MNKTTFKDIIKLNVVPYHSELAASYGKLNAESVKDMDDELKVRYLSIYLSISVCIFLSVFIYI